MQDPTITATGQHHVDVASPASDVGYLVAGFFTPDYRKWVDVLVGDLQKVGAPFHFEAIEKADGDWAATTCLKAAAVLRALDRHPGKTIIWLDVDCRVLGDIAPLAVIDADIAIRMTAPRPGARKSDLHPWSGTMVFAPTDLMRRLVENWVASSIDVARGVDDENTLVIALSKTPNIKVCLLGEKWCSTLHFHAVDAIIQHASAGLLERKAAERFRPMRAVKVAKRRLVEIVVGKPYREWKHGKS